MTEPRLEESASAFERELLQAGNDYHVSAESRARTLTALGLGATAGAVGAAAAASQSTVLGKLAVAKGWLGVGWVKGTVAAVATVGALASAPVLYRSLSAETPPAPPTLAATPPQPTPPQPTPPEGAAVVPPANAPTQVEEVLPSEDAAVEGSSKARAAAPSAKSEPPEVTTEVLRAELAALDAARAKLASGSPKGALAALDEYGRSYPRGLLRLEAEVLRIDALAQAGQTDVAKARASAFLRKHPKGVLAARVRRYAEP